MKVAKPSGNDLKNTAALGGGVVLGIGFSKGIFGLIHDDEKTIVDPAEQKKHDNMGMVKHAGLSVASAGVAAAIKSTDIISLVAKGILVGVAGQQASEVVTKLASKSTAVQQAAASTDPVKRAAAKALGLGCACGQHNALNGYRRRGSRRGLKMVVDAAQYIPDYAQIQDQPANSLEQALSSGRQISQN